MAKLKFVTEDVCKAKMNDLADIKEDVKDIKKHVNNHVLHISTDVTKLSGCLGNVKSNIEDMKESLRYLTESCGKKKLSGHTNMVSEKLLMRILLIILILVMITYGVIVGGDPALIPKVIANGG